MHQNCGYINKCVSGHVHEIGDLAARHHLDASKVAMEHDLVGGPGPPRPEKMMDFVNWDDDIPQYFWENKIDGNQTTNQLVSEFLNIN